MIRLRRTNKACAPLVHLSVCASGAFELVRLWCKRSKISVGKLPTPNLMLQGRTGAHSDFAPLIDGKCSHLPVVAIKKGENRFPALSRLIRLRRTRSEFECEEKAV